MLALGALALLLLFLAAPAGAASGRTVSVAATATIEVPRDSARLGFGVFKERPTRGAALRAASAKLRRVIAAARSVPGVEPGAVGTGAISVHKVTRGAKTVYRATQGVSVTLSQADRAGELVRKAIAAGATGVRGPYFFVADTDGAARRALAAAFAKAQARAATLAAAAGATLGPVLTIDEGGETKVEIVAPKSEDNVGSSFESASEAEPAPPTKPGRAKVRATVHAVFELL